MKNALAIAAVSGLALSIGLVTTPATASPASVSQGMVFVQNDDPAGGNQVVAYQRSADGSLHQAGTYPTGGLGGSLEGAVVDRLASQGSLTYDEAHRTLYVVNAGSNTVTVFGVVGDRLVRRQVISSGGTFPVSIAIHGAEVYILNARAGGAVQGYLSVLGRLVPLHNEHRALGLPVTTGAQEFTHTPGQIVVTPDGSSVIVTTKAAGSSLLVFGRYGLARLTKWPTVVDDAGNVPFAAVFDRFGHLAVAEAGTNGVATYAVDREHGLRLLNRTATGQTATCWIAVAGSNYYLSNAGSNSLSGYHAERDGSPTALGNTATGEGTVDAAVTPDNRYLYVQTGKTGAVDAFRIQPDGSLSKLSTTVVPHAAGTEGIATT
ncbi:MULTISPECIES: lactonase family protein [Kribbella]|uniref:6-phosphogluconolactonase (Cycloisomerase 2 family) n=1 Tax=Kribbella karoonensis TaxID=324851 RepID=A0ABP4NZ56_9ACTN